LLPDSRLVRVVVIVITVLVIAGLILSSVRFAF
jgi:hypothetical protein